MRLSRGFGTGVAGCCCAVALAACGGGSSGGYSPTAQQAVRDAQSALRQANGFALTGALTQDGQPAKLSFSADAKGSLDLSIALGSRSFQVIILSGAATYINGNAAFWTSASGSAAAALAGRWFKFSEAQAGQLTSSLGGFEPSNLPRCLGEGLGTLSLGGKTTVAGASAIVVHNAGNTPGSAAGELDVAESSPHYPLRLTNTSGTRPGGKVDVCNDGKGSHSIGAVSFTNFGHVKTISAPAGAQTIPGS